jgi:hypothetical protein
MRARPLLLLGFATIVGGCADNTLLSTQPELSASDRLSSTSSAVRWAPKEYFRPAPAPGTSRAEFFAASNAASANATVNEPDIKYHGGSLITTESLVAIYYSPTRIYANGPQPQSGAVAPGTRDRSLVGFFLNNVGASDRWNVNTMYYEMRGSNKNFVQGAMTYSSYWATAAGAPGPGGTVTDDDMVTVIERGFASGALRYDPNTLYMIFTGPGVNLGGGFSSDNLQYCAWHSAYYRDNGQIVQVSAMPYDGDFNPEHPSTAGYICTYLTRGPNDDYGADATVSAMLHETEETATDPYIDGFLGWWDKNGEESSDKCAYHYGTVNDNGIDYWNLRVGGKPFLVQQQWALSKIQGCLTGLPRDSQQLAAQ